MLWRALLEGAGQLPVDEVRVGAVEAVVEVPAQGGRESRGKAAVLIVEELIASIVAIHG
jgi:hypothetical protein